MLGHGGYVASLQYARDRMQGRAHESAQGRPTGDKGKDPNAPQVRIIEHADVKRMLLAQKARWKARWRCSCIAHAWWTSSTRVTRPTRNEARLLLEVLTPIAKSWPSQWCLEANSLAIQIHGGYGYTRDFPVEQYWRDNRLNMIHEGTHGIQAMDLLGRKVMMNGGAGLKLLAKRMAATIEQAGHHTGLAFHANALSHALQLVGSATKAAWATGDANTALANAVSYLEAFGHTVVAWMWLDVSLAATRAESSPMTRGKLHAARYFFAHELPKVQSWLAPVTARDDTTTSMQADWF